MTHDATTIIRVTPPQSIEIFFASPELCERFNAEMGSNTLSEPDASFHPGWYWWSCQPGCLPDGDGIPVGPFKTFIAAFDDAQGNDQ